MWKVGKGDQVIVGKDLILGGSLNYRLYEGLVSYLNQNGFCFLCLSRRRCRGTIESSSWMRDRDLGIDDELEA